MNINRHNYEEVFLLYVDNELSAADRKAVELFVQQNVDLKEELNLLQQTVFDADDVVFDNKGSLLKEEITALQENLLLYIDGELSAADTIHTERLLQTDSAAKKELALLQQTKLQADTAIVFANRKSLYRKEGGRVIALPWRRIAAAAILLGFGTWATVSYLNNTPSTPGGSMAQKNQPKATTLQQSENKAAAPVVQIQQPTVADVNTTAVKNVPAVKQTAQRNTPLVKNKSLQSVPENEKENTLVSQELKKPDNKLPKPSSENINNTESNKTGIATVTPKSTATDKINNSGLNKTVDVLNNITNNSEVSGYALNANYSEDNASNSLSSDDAKAKKTKLGGFLRKVKRLVDRNTNDESGKGVKIAGFDIAIK